MIKYRGTPYMETKLTSFATLVAAFVKALATVAEEIGVKAAISAVANKGEQLTQMIRLIFIALTTGQDLVLAGDKARTERPSVLGLISIRAASGINKFIAKDHFEVGTIKGVQIGFVCDNFKKYFLGKVEKNVEGAVLRVYKTLADSFDVRIINDLGDNYSTTLAHMWELVATQHEGEDGILLTNERFNIFCIKDQEGTLRMVAVYWGNGGWHLCAGPVGGPIQTNADNQVFGR